MSQPEDFACRICGLRQLSPPWGDDGKTPSFEICDRCGTEFGYEDATVEAIQLNRERWLSEGGTRCDRNLKLPEILT